MKNIGKRVIIIPLLTFFKRSFLRANWVQQAFHRLLSRSYSANTSTDLTYINSKNQTSRCAYYIVSYAVVLLIFLILKNSRCKIKTMTLRMKCGKAIKITKEHFDKPRANVWYDLYWYVLFNRPENFAMLWKVSLVTRPKSAPFWLDRITGFYNP